LPRELVYEDVAYQCTSEILACSKTHQSFLIHLRKNKPAISEFDITNDTLTLRVTHAISI
jgi:hypothetical protein